MSKKTQHTDLTAICKHISRIMGNDRRTSGIISEIQNWVTLSGSRWTLDRLKVLKTSVIGFRSDETLKLQRTFLLPKNSYIKHDSSGWPKGNLGSFIKSCLLSQSNQDKKLSKLLSVLEVGRAFKLREVSDAQRKKFLEAIRGKPKRDDLFDYSYKLGKQCSETFPKSYLKRFKYYYRDAFGFNFAGLNTSKPMTSFMPEGIKDKTNKWLLSFIEGTVVEGPWTEILKEMNVPIKGNTPKAIFAGRIQVLQEGGHKARVIAMPTAGIQVAFKPLHDSLGKILRAMPEDCTYDQMKGVKWGARMLKDGKRVHAVDLSSATDNFPLGFQKAVLESLGYKHVDNFVATCKLKWGFEGIGPLEYTKGQPMGLYGSFALFALSHHFVLKKLERKFGVSDCYRILGDDIIISNDDVHSEYLKFMERVGVPISLHKCLDSDLFTEFAGKFISVNGRIPVVKGPKQIHKKNLIDINSFRNYCEVTATTAYSIKSVPRRYREYAINLMSLPHSYGGLGLNPEGLPLEDRLVRFEESKLKSYPMMTDLSYAVRKLPFLATDDHVAHVCYFINEQLTMIHDKIKRNLRNYGYNADNYSLDFSRSLLNQVLQAKGKDDPVSFSGTLSEDSTNSVFQDWAKGFFSQMRKVEKAFDEGKPLSEELFEIEDFIKTYKGCDIPKSKPSYSGPQFN